MTDSEPKIENVRDLVDSFGGTTEFARWLDVGASTVSNWKAEQAIPRGYHLQIYLEMKRRKLNVDIHQLFRLDQGTSASA